MPPYRYSFAAPVAAPPKAEERSSRERLLAAVDHLPPLPAVLSRVLRMLNDEYCSSTQIASLIEKDSVLSGSVLRCVNSAYYGLMQRVSSIRQAVTLLGFGTVRNLALGFSMRRMLSSSKAGNSKLYAAYSQHALGCAVMTQFLALYSHTEDADAAFAAGLFHDIGELLIINTLPQMAPKLIAHWEQGDGTLEDSERELLGVTHPELSGVVLERWELPESLQMAARYHARPDLDPARGEDFHTLPYLVHAADLFVRYHGLDVLTSAEKPPESPEPALRQVGLDQSLEEIEERFTKEFESIRAAFQA